MSHTTEHLLNQTANDGAEYRTAAKDIRQLIDHSKLMKQAREAMWKALTEFEKQQARNELNRLQTQLYEVCDKLDKIY